MESSWNEESRATTRWELTLEMPAGELPFPQPPREKVRKNGGPEGYYARARDGAEAALDGGAPGVANGSGGLTASMERGRNCRPRGAAALRERQREVDDETDRWARRGSDSSCARDRPIE